MQNDFKVPKLSYESAIKVSLGYQWFYTQH